MSFNLGANFIGNSLFAAVKLTKNADPDRYSYFGYGIGFDAPRSFSLSDGSGFGKHVTIFWVDDTSSVYSDKRKKDSW